ncbi:hypothetical protein E4U53_006456 [Claviceps sorghi]|nr:hypothetical protein E4U53_006456 [Claviceps sorghi]
MCSFKMTIFTGVIALLGAFATGSLAQSTETLAPSPLGTATSDGAVLVTMNYCTVVANTQCQVSVMTSAAAAATNEPAAGSGPLPTNPGSASAVSPASTEAPPDSSSGYASEVTAPASTLPSTALGAPAMTNTPLTAAAAGIKALPAAAWGAAILAMAALM